jgi:ubiquinone/menaquinone biosynthesis C-methylase UbiE
MDDTQHFNQRGRIQADIDSKSKSYADKYKIYNYETRGYHIRNKLALEWLGNAPLNILEAGCGPAILSLDLLQRGHQPFGIDLSEMALRAGRERIACQVNTFTVGDLVHLPYGAASFDAVVCLGVLEYVIPIKAALIEFSRIIRPGGSLVFSLPNRQSFYRKWERHVYGPLSSLFHSVYNHKKLRSYIRQEYAITDIGPLLEKAGLTLEKMHIFSLAIIFQPVNRLIPGPALRISDWAETHLQSFFARRLSGIEILVRAMRT